MSTPPPAQKKIVGDGRRVKGVGGRVHYREAVKGWVAPMPTIDPQIVLRSARALPDVYGPNFSYGHFIRVGRITNVIAGGLGLAGVVTLAQFRPTRKWLLDRRKSGEGSSPETRAKSYFKVSFTAKTPAGIHSAIASGGDPGYGETSKMLAETALALAFDTNTLPNAAGVLTPVVAGGDALLVRLRNAGLVFDLA